MLCKHGRYYSQNESRIVPAVPAAATAAAATAMFTIDGKTLCVRCAPHPESTNDNHL